MDQLYSVFKFFGFQKQILAFKMFVRELNTET